ncbi:MAG: DUF5626 family protein [Solobacterium sp.]|nr:DUF5626 family protein [Solobacterium sp.]
MIKKLLIVLCAIIMTTIPIKAQDVKTTEEQNEAISFSVDEAYQEYVFIDEKGILTTISVTSSLNGEHLIKMQNEYLTMSYKIYINNSNQISSAYDGNYSVSGYSVSSSSLTVDSSVQATYTITLSSLWITTSKYLRSNISSGSIVVTHN